MRRWSSTRRALNRCTPQHSAPHSRSAPSLATRSTHESTQCTHLSYPQVISTTVSRRSEQEFLEMSKEDRDKFIEENKTRSQARPPAGSVVRAHFDCVPRSHHARRSAKSSSRVITRCSSSTFTHQVLMSAAAGRSETAGSLRKLRAPFTPISSAGLSRQRWKPPHMTSLEM